MSVRASLFLAVLCLAAMLLLGAVHAWLQPLDESVACGLSLRAETSPPLLVAIMQGISRLGGGVPRWALALVLTAWLWRAAGRRPALLLVGTAVVANLASSLLKTVFERPRPDLIPHLDHVSSWSYPSGHATSVTAIALGFALLAPPAWRRAAEWAAAAAILLTALSRVMLGVHWPSDVLGGILLGAGTALAIAGFQRRGRAPSSANSAISEP